MALEKSAFPSTYFSAHFQLINKKTQWKHQKLENKQANKKVEISQKCLAAVEQFFC